MPNTSVKLKPPVVAVFLQCCCFVFKKPFLWLLILYSNKFFIYNKWAQNQQNLAQDQKYLMNPASI